VDLAGELRERDRGMAGALLVLGISFAYTRETWWLPVKIPPSRLIAFVVAGLELVVPMARSVGFRSDDAGGRLRVAVAFENRGQDGLSSVTVEVTRGDTQRSLVFTQVPARGRGSGTAMCPLGTIPTARVKTWLQA